MSTNTSDSILNTPKYLLFFALVLGFACVTMFQGSRGLYETTEGRYALCARETYQNGNPFEPMLHGEHHWTKPPLTYMAIASGLAIFGENSTWGARFYLIPAFFFTIIFVYLFAKNLWDEMTGIISALIYAVSPFLVAGANTISTDTLLVLWHAITFFAFWKAYQTKQRLYIYLFWLGIGLGCITKGPMGFIPLMGILPFCLWRWISHKEKLWFFISPIGIAIFLVVGIAWYLWENWKYPGLLQYWLFHETIGRIAEGEFDRNPEWYKVFPLYILPTLLGTGGWMFLLMYVVYKNKKIFNKVIYDENFRPEQWAFLIASFVFPYVFFLFSKSKLALYILPTFIPLTIGIAKIFGTAIKEKIITHKSIIIIGIINAIIIITLKGVSAYYPNAKDMKQLANDIKPLLNQFSEVSLYCVKSEDLNGFEFYTNIPVPEIKLIEEASKETPFDEIAKNICTFLSEPSLSKRILLLPRKHEKTLSLLNLPKNIKIYPVNKFWSAIYYNE